MAPPRSQTFWRSLGWLVSWERGLADDPADRGGRTQAGITQGTYDDWRTAQHLPSRPVDELAVSEWFSIYRDRYWRAARCDDLPPLLATAVFDAAVHHGPDRAVKMLQRTVLTEQDGRFGPKTALALETALAQHGERNVVEAYLDWREVFCERIAAQDPSQRVWLANWKARLVALRTAIEWVAA
jgi:lysozyme family protein